jgi:hypothetical protein
MITDRQHWQDRSISCPRLGRRLGEPEVGHWHRHDKGFGSRRPLAELPTGRGSGSLA